MSVHALPAAYPENQAAERAFLGGVLADPEEIGRFDLEPGDFYAVSHGELWRLLRSMSRAGMVIDCTTTVPEQVMSRNPERFGGLPYVLELPDAATSTVNLSHYAETIRNTATHRRLLERIDAWRAQAVDPIEARNVVGSILSDIAGIRWTEEVQRDTSLGGVLTAAIDDIEGRLGMSPAVRWPWGELTHITGGLMPGELCIVAARPSMGKTALVQDAARMVAASPAYGDVLIYNYEGTAASLAMRHLMAKVGITQRDLRLGNYNSSDVRKLRAAAAQVQGSPAGRGLHIIQAHNLTIEGIEADVIRRNQDGQLISMVIIDYLQLVPASDPKLPREQQVSQISAGCRRIATREDFEVGVVALAQLNRKLEDRKDKRPMLSDLRESGSLEQDADQVLFVHRDGYYESADSRANPGEAEVIVAKNRNGDTGTAELWFERGHFYDVRSQ